LIIWLSGIAVGCYRGHSAALSGASLGRLFTYMCLYPYVPAQAGEVAVGMVSYWPGITSWGGNFRYGVILAMHHRQQWYFHVQAHSQSRVISSLPYLVDNVTSFDAKFQ